MAGNSSLSKNYHFHSKSRQNEWFRAILSDFYFWVLENGLKIYDAYFWDYGSIDFYYVKICHTKSFQKLFELISSNDIDEPS